MSVNNASGWNQETKSRLSEKIQQNVNDISSLTRQMIRGSKTNELLAQAAKNFAFQETAINNSHETIKRMALITTQLQFQAEAIERSMEMMDNVQDQLKTIQR
ncbi:BLOC-1-related complex subunit 7-like [Tubulanus polymorphus]|uniref:BLOC-1-related complex subunit 7-like n=1 Tax=Tubulanus polymorphus TaxID=672921 RepID=UPI003DA2C3E1